MKSIPYLAVLIVLMSTVPSQAQSPKSDAKLMAQGARVWAQNCMRCHNARSSFERNDRDWTTIVAHMRARANLTRREAHAVAAFLRSSNAPEASPSPAPAAPPVTDPPATEPSDAADKQKTEHSDSTKTSGMLSVMEIQGLLRFLATVQ